MKLIASPRGALPGDYVAVLHEIVEFPPITWTGAWLVPGSREAIRVQRCPCPTPGPLRVVSVCLPFVLMKDVNGKCRTFDVRLRTFARLGRRYGRKAFERLRKKEPENATPAATGTVSAKEGA